MWNVIANCKWCMRHWKSEWLNLGILGKKSNVASPPSNPPLSRNLSKDLANCLLVSMNTIWIWFNGCLQFLVSRLGWVKDNSNSNELVKSKFEELRKTVEWLDCLFIFDEMYNRIYSSFWSYQNFDSLLLKGGGTHYAIMTSKMFSLCMCPLYSSHPYKTFDRMLSQKNGHKFHVAYLKLVSQL